MRTFLLTLFAFIFSSSAFAIETYHLRCRGGGKHEFQLYAEEYGSWLTMHFQRSTTTYIAPGQCSWDDRPVNSAEPTRVCQHQNLPTGRFSVSFFVRGDGTTVMLPVTANVKWIRKMAYDNEYQSFYAATNPALNCIDIYALD